MNTCVKCKSHLHDIKNPSAPQVWYNHFCLSSERVPATDPVTGEKGFVGTNSLGTQYVDEQKYDYCRDVNKGSCILFVEN